MPVDIENSEREQTDESLRLERERADLALGAELALIDETADAVIHRARARVDRVLAATRALTDRGDRRSRVPPADGKVVVRLERIGDELAFAVIDTGIGIAEDKLEHIFERFLQVDATDRRGLGLGLYISKCIVQGNGGRIWAESRLGEGSAFHFTLPIAASA